MVNSLYEVLSSYGIQPSNLTQITPFIYKVEDGKNVYALKQSGLTRENISRWERVFHEAYHYKLSAILSVYMTFDQSLFTEVNEEIYYMSPWIFEQAEQENKVRDLYEVIGTVHYETKRYKSVDNDLLISEFEAYEVNCEKMKKQLISTVEQFEAQHFMSPLELQVCTHFRDLELAIILLQKRIQQFLKEQEQADNNEWGFSLCHGQLKDEHFLLSSQGNHHLINWEKSSYQYPMMDLVFYFKQELLQYNAPKEEIINGFTVYMEKNKLTKSELYLMLIHLLDPTQYLTYVEQYVQHQNSEMIEITKLLQKQFRITFFAIELSHFIEKEYESLFETPVENHSHSK